MAAIAHPIGLTAERSYPKTGLWAYLTTVDHKKIAILYLLFSGFFFAMGGTEAFLMRLQLIRPDNTLVSSAFFSQLFTMHGTTMIFLAVMPLQIGLINAVVPLQIGARDVAFPRMNAISLWLFVLGGLFLNTSWFLGGAPNAGWFSYAPISINQYNAGPGIDFYALGLQLAGIGTLMTGINFLATIVNMRAPGMSWMRLPLFTWTTVITTVLIIFAFPPLTVNLFLLIFDRLAGATFFNVPTGGNVLLWQNLFWIFGHPEVYILIMPAFGILSEVIATFSRKGLFGYDTMVMSIIAIGFLAFMVWTHHMFTVGMGPWVNSIFAITSMAIAVPTGVKIFNWIFTMWGGKVRFTTSMLFATAFIPIFVIGGITGVMLAAAPADFQFNDSYFVVAHIHYVLIGGSLLGVLAGLFYWYPKMTGKLMDERLGKWAFWLIVVGFNVTFFPQHFLGLWGMPRRVFTYSTSLGSGVAFWNAVSTYGVFILGAGFILVVVNIFKSLKFGEASGPDPWDARTLEWAIPSPAPEYNFASIPLIRGRDAWWVEKKQGEGKLVPARPESVHRPIHLPAPTWLPIIFSLSLCTLAYGALYKNMEIIVIAVLAAMFWLYLMIAKEDRGMMVAPEGSEAE